MCVCFGLRISECLALRWFDVDWFDGKLRIERRIVEQNVDDVKTDGSRRSLTVATELMQRLKLWKQRTQFPADGDWIFASPFKIDRLPYSYTGVWRELQRAAGAAGIGKLGTRAFRHTYRSWLDAVGTPIAVQQKLMRHSDIRTRDGHCQFQSCGTCFEVSLTDCKRIAGVCNCLKEWLLR